MGAIAAALLAPEVLSAGINAGQGIMGMVQNRANRKHAIKMMDKQRNWALEDWHMQNEYNSPRAQMQRLQEAGLNPNLVYGQGVQGASGNAGNIRSTGGGEWRGETPNFSGLNNTLFTHLDMKQRNAQIDLLEKQTTAKIQEASLIAARTGETLAKAAKTNFELSQAKRLKDISFETAAQGLQKLLIGNQFQLDENERRKALTAGNLAQAAERVLLMRAQTANTKEQRDMIREQIRSVRLDGDLKKLDKDLREQGIYPNAPWWMKVLENYLDTKTNGRPFGGDLDFIPPSPAHKQGPKTGWPYNADPKNWYKWNR